MFPRFFLLVLCVLLIVGLPVTAQSDDPLPPNVTNIQPLPGVPVTPDGSLTVMFNQPMASASLTFEPDIAGSIVWPNVLTLTFTPNATWPIGVDYAVTLVATSQSGVDLVEPVTFDVLGPPPLTLTTVSPEPRANAVSADTDIVIGFDRPVVPLESVSVPSNDLDMMPLTVQRSTQRIAGTGEWLTTSLYRFMPQYELSGGVSYVVTVEGGLVALDGTILDRTESWVFTTSLPNVLAVESTRALNGQLQPDSDIRVQFNQAMAQGPTEAVVELRRLEGPIFEYQRFATLGEQVAVGYRWLQNDRVLELDPEIPLEPGYSYALVFTGDTQSAYGGIATFDGWEVLELGYMHDFPRTTTPGQDDVVRPGVRRVAFHFDMPMNNENFRDHFRIEPEPSGTVTPYVTNDDTTFELEFYHADNTTYIVTLLAGIEDQWGHAMPSDYVLTYHVQSAQTATRDSASLNLPYPFVTAPAYQTPPSLNLGVSGKPTVQFDIYRADIDLVAQSDNVFYGYSRRGLYYPPWDLAERENWQISVPWVADEYRVHQWTTTFDDSNDDAGYVPLTLADNEPLPLGLYGIELTSPDLAGYAGRDGVLLAVANAGITVKAAADGDSAVWVTDLKTGVPLPGATVAVYNRDGELAASGITDSEGVFLVPRGPFDSGGVIGSGYSDYYMGRYSGINFIEVTGDDLYGAWHNGDVNGGPATGSYIYTDRPIYRPGETVYFRGVLRDRDDMTFTVPPDVTTARVQVGRWDGYYYNPTLIDIFHEADLNVTAFGTFSGSFIIPRELPLSGPYSPYSIYVTACADDRDCAIYHTTIEFEVAEFRVPEFEVEVIAQRDEMIAGESLDVDVRAAYYFGGTVNGGNLQWNMRGSSTYFKYTGEERGYTFGSYTYYYAPFHERNGSGRLDVEGQFHIDSDVERRENMFRPGILTVEATVTDESGQSISAVSDGILVHPAEVYIGLRTPDRFQPTDTPFDIDVLTINPQSESIGGQPVDIEVIEHRWVRIPTEYAYYDWENVKTLVSKASIVTDENGYATYQFNAPNAGRFEIVAHTQDSMGRDAQTVLWVYARDTYQTSTRVWWQAEDYYWWDFFYRGEPYVTMLADAEEYTPGDTAEVLIPNPFEDPVEVLVTVERAGVMSHEAVHIEGDALVYTLDITDDHAPAIWVSVVMIRGVTDEYPDPTYRFGRIQLDVEPVARRLNIEITPSATELAPRDELVFDVHITDAHGNPVQAEVGLHLTDDAVLALRPPNSKTLEKAFYSDGTLRVFVTTSHMSLLSWQEPPGPPGFGGGGGGGLGEALVREDFVYTPLWAPHVVTDADGYATVSVTLPDNLTRWRLDARAVTLDTDIGQAQTTVISTLPLVVRPDVPRYFVVGDQLPVSGIINNNTDEPQTVTVTLDSTGLRLLDGVSVTQRVEVAAYSRQVVEWPVIVEDVPGVDMTIYAEAESGLSDAAKPALRTGPDETVAVYRYTAPETVATAGALYNAGRAQEGILLPTSIEPVGGDLTVQLDSSLAAPIVDGLTYLRHYPHFCVEQTVSRFYPNLMTSQMLTFLEPADLDLEDSLRENIEPALEKLVSEQNPDGGWGWFGRMESNPYVSAYVLLALADAADAGYAVPAETLSAATGFLDAYLNGFDASPTTNDYQLNRAAFALYALARAGTFHQSAYDGMMDLRQRLSNTALAHLALAIDTTGNTDQAVELVSDLVDRAIITGTSVHWADTRDPYNWGSDTRTTATVTLALTRLRPDHPLLSGAIRWLMAARRADHWPTTQETAWTLLALGEWLRATNELNGDYTYHVALNDATLTEGSVTPEEVRTSNGSEAVLRVEVSDLLATDVNLIDISRSTGEGALYYVARLEVDLPADEVDALSRGITIRRSYRQGDYQGRQIDQIEVGDTVTVRLDFTLDQDTHYFVLEDFLPAGLEVLDTNLLTTSREVSSPRVTDSRHYWWYRYFDRVEVRDTGAVLYADYLPRGSYTFIYTVQATQPGVFQAIPAQSYAFYTPEVFGRTAGQTFTVEGRFSQTRP